MPAVFVDYTPGVGLKPLRGLIRILKCPICGRATGYTVVACDDHLGSLCIKESEIPNAGLGLFAAARFEAGVPISTVIGERMNDHEIVARYGAGTANCAPYAIQIRKNLILDEIFIRSPCAYANDPLDLNKFRQMIARGTTARNAYKLASTDPNSEMHTVGNGATLIATKRIEPGDEILWHYGSSYWSP